MPVHRPNRWSCQPSEVQGTRFARLLLVLVILFPLGQAQQVNRCRWLQGAPVWLVSAEPVADWPLQAPRIAGTPPGNDAELVTLLSSGIWRDGKPLRPPMPQFHMTREDADSIVAYLKSLGAGPQ
jgi:hypothetical protein